VPLDEIIPIGFSMGGLVVRGGCHVASLEGHRWIDRVQRAIYVGTPHLGAPLERAGRVFTRVMRAIPDPYTRLIAELGDMRSDGIKDLGDGDVRHEDRARRQHRFALRDPRHPVPLLDRIRHHLVAASIAKDPTFAPFFGDALVPVPSATNGECIVTDPYALLPEHVKILGGVAHITLAHHPEVYAHVRAWCEEAIR
jgi:hypothetical protein